MVTPFPTLAAVDEWLAHDTILCLRCGRRFQHLGRHLVISHDMTADEFRELYGVPHNRGLIGARLKDRRVTVQREVMARDLEHRAKFVMAKRRRPYSIHHASATQLAELRLRIQPIGNKARWG